ncbi:polysaccharide lyase [Leeuwenhoekiella palythoae]|uniref:polysaccharide lyase n=1 Tax=Leeuwenhoekiella TaxID=283735 RepID=UPI00142FF8E7|nr:MULTISPECIES: polysaccharide lyase [Leeuwenhoekiella]UBZ11047.1 polysaccharide lyase [Leeuwenhoekiella palythoae]
MQSIQQDSSSVKINFVDELPFLSSQKLINEYAQKVIPLKVGSKLNNSRNVQRFELKWNDNAVSGGKRSEMVYNSVTAKERWYTFSTYLEDFISDSYSVIIFQLHGVPDKNEAYREPNIAIAIQNNEYFLRVIGDQNRITDKSKVTTRYAKSLGLIKDNTWSNWVMHIKLSYGKDGLLEVWKDGKLVHQEMGPNCYNDRFLPYLKFGLYIPGWKGLKKAPLAENRVIYFDNVIIKE